MQQHSGVAVWKDLGYYSTDVGPSLTNAMINKENKLEKVTLDMYGFLDNMTWGKIWGACKLKVEETMNIHEGDEGYWQAVMNNSEKLCIELRYLTLYYQDPN